MRRLTMLCVFIMLPAAAAVALDPADYTGMVVVDSVAASPGESFSVEVWIEDNNISLSALVLPVRFDNPDLTLDSMSIAGTVWSSSFVAYSVIDDEAQIGKLTVLPADIEYPLPTVTVVDGVIARLHFTLSHLATRASTVIDSVYSDTELSGGMHVYIRVEVSDNIGLSVYLPGFRSGKVEVMGPTGVAEGAVDGLPSEYALSQNYPNPFNPTTVIAYSLPAAGRVRLEVFNILGQAVETLVDEPMPAGDHSAVFDGRDIPSGIYFYRLQYEGGSLTRKMVMLK